MEERGWQPPSDMSTWHSDRIFGLVLQVMMVVMVKMMVVVVEDVELVVGSFKAKIPATPFQKRNTAHMK